MNLRAIDTNQFMTSPAGDGSKVLDSQSRSEDIQQPLSCVVIDLKRFTIWLL
jgi:hypothetical protein